MERFTTLTKAEIQASIAAAVNAYEINASMTAAVNAFENPEKFPIPSSFATEEGTSESEKADPGSRSCSNSPRPSLAVSPSRSSESQLRACRIADEAACLFAAQRFDEVYSTLQGCLTSELLSLLSPKVQLQARLHYNLSYFFVFPISGNIAFDRRIIEKRSKNGKPFCPLEALIQFNHWSRFFPFLSRMAPSMEYQSFSPPRDTVPLKRSTLCLCHGSGRL